MTGQSVTLAILFVLGGIAVFVAFWYLLGVGIGIAQRGYNRVAPYRIMTKISAPPTYTTYQRPLSTWEDWEHRS